MKYSDFDRGVIINDNMAAPTPRRSTPLAGPHNPTTTKSVTRQSITIYRHDRNSILIRHFYIILTNINKLGTFHVITSIHDGDDDEDDDGDDDGSSLNC